jgi:hypothetical protein
MPHQSDALEARGCYQVESTTVLPALPSRHDRLSNRWGLLLYNYKKRWCCDIAGLSIGARERAPYAGERAPVGNPCSCRRRFIAGLIVPLVSQ